MNLHGRVKGLWRAVPKGIRAKHIGIPEAVDGNESAPGEIHCLHGVNNEVVRPFFCRAEAL